MLAYIYRRFSFTHSWLIIYEFSIDFNDALSFLCCCCGADFFGIVMPSGTCMSIGHCDTIELQSRILQHTRFHCTLILVQTHVPPSSYILTDILFLSSSTLALYTLLLPSPHPLLRIHTLFCWYVLRPIQPQADMLFYFLKLAIFSACYVICYFPCVTYTAIILAGASTCTPCADNTYSNVTSATACTVI